jgi:DNA-directed RNA polymerase subunit M/transcription elongation factor TFIIS
MSQPESPYRDSCPECLEGPYEPYETEVRGENLVGAYRCTRCGHVWPCWWNTSSLPSDASLAGDVA